MGLSIDGHRRLGHTLLGLHEQMLETLEEIYEHYPPDSKVWTSTNRAAGAIMELRCILYACLSQEQAQERQIDPLRVYFDAARKKKALTSPALLPPPESRQ